MTEGRPHRVTPGQPTRLAPVLLDQYGRPVLARQPASRGSKPDRYVTYRLPAATFWASCVGPVVALAIFLFAALVAGGGGLRWVGLGVALFLALLLWRARTVATTTTPKEVIARGIPWTRRIPWAEIQDIRIRLHGLGAGPSEILVLYDRAGRSVILPNLNERDLAAKRPSLADEVDALRATWQRRRGSAWAPVPDVQQRIARLTQQGDSPWLLGMIAAMLSFLPMIVIALLALGFNLADRGLPWSVLFAPESMLVVPVLTFVIVCAVGLQRRARARRDTTS
jgi:hypothetical protein